MIQRARADGFAPNTSGFTTLIDLPGRIRNHPLEDVGELQLVLFVVHVHGGHRGAAGAQRLLGECYTCADASDELLGGRSNTLGSVGRLWTRSWRANRSATQSTKMRTFVLRWRFGG
jgi:hypothetical protein